MAHAIEQEMKAKTQEMKAIVLAAEAEALQGWNVRGQNPSPAEQLGISRNM